MSLCAINIHKKEDRVFRSMQFLYFKIRDNEVERIRGDKYGISAVDYGLKREFTSIYVDFEAGDAFLHFFLMGCQINLEVHERKNSVIKIQVPYYHKSVEWTCRSKGKLLKIHLKNGRKRQNKLMISASLDLRFNKKNTYSRRCFSLLL